MGRFSPTVEPVPDLGLANALGSFTESYMQAQNRKDRRAQQDRQNDVEMLQGGYQPDEVASATPPPVGPLARLRAALTGRTDPDQIATAVHSAAPAVQGANDVNTRLAEALSSGESSGFVQDQPTGGGNYATNERPIQQQGTPAVRRITIGGRTYRQTDDARAAEEERRRRATLADALGQAQISNYKSEADLRRYQIEHPKPVAPVPGSPEWLALKVQEAKITGEYGYHPPRNIDPLSAEGIKAQQQIAAGKPAPGSQPNESELKGAAMQHRVIPAGQRVNQFDNRKTLDELSSRAGFMGNWASTPGGRQLRNAGKIWAMSVLRPESGASISDKELDGYFETYLPRPGDDEDTLAQKRQARREAEEAVSIQGGRALPKGTATSAIQADSLAGAGPRSAAGKTVSVNGKTFLLPD